MLEISNKTNLLEQKSYKYSLQDVADPNLYRDIYPYDSVPQHRVQPSARPDGDAGRHLDHRYVVPRRSAVCGSVHRRIRLWTCIN